MSETFQAQTSMAGIEPLLSLKPMATAPRPKYDEQFRLLVLDEWTECEGLVERDWRLVYWLEAWDGRPAGWYGNNCGDLRHPVGWVLSTASLQMPAPKL